VVVRGFIGSTEIRGRLLAPLRAGADSAQLCRHPGPPCTGRVEPWQVGWLVPSTLDHLDVQVGTRATHGAIIGGLIGTALAVVGAGFATGFCEWDCPSTGELLFRGTAFVVLPSAGIGALIGSGFPRFARRF
jgi:hypothetical protein